MSRAASLAERNNVECPSCGSVLTRCRGGGRSTDGHRLRRRICDDCSLIFTTMEVPLLYDDGSAVPITAVDDEQRWYHRIEQRRRVKYWGSTAGRAPYVDAARIQLRLRVSRPVRRGEEAA